MGYRAAETYNPDAPLLRSEKIEPVHELDWGELVTLSGFSVHSVPALHFSARGIFDRNKTLWCGYAIEFPKTTRVFCGRHWFRKSFCADSGEVRLSTARIIAHWSA